MDSGKENNRSTFHHVKAKVQIPATIATFRILRILMREFQAGLRDRSSINP